MKTDVAPVSLPPTQIIPPQFLQPFYQDLLTSPTSVASLTDARHTLVRRQPAELLNLLFDIGQRARALRIARLVLQVLLFL